MGYGGVKQARVVSLQQGTLDYMPPEVLRCPDKAHAGQGNGRADLACLYSYSADVWALGALVHELLLGASPFARACTASTIQAWAHPQMCRRPEAHLGRSNAWRTARPCAMEELMLRAGKRFGRPPVFIVCDRASLRTR